MTDVLPPHETRRSKRRSHYLPRKFIPAILSLIILGAIIFLIGWLFLHTGFEMLVNQ